MARLTTSIAEQDIKENLNNNLKSKFPGIAWSGRDSVLNSIVEAVGDELVLLRREMSSLFDMSQISNLSGDALEASGMRMFGVARKAESFAQTSYLEKNFYFYVENKTFGDINSGEDIFIPSKTIVGTSIDPELGTIVYEVQEDYILEKDSSIMYCSVKATNPGNSQNVDSESLIYHNFNNYTLNNLDELRCTNRFAILNGSDLENDSLYKIRLNNYISTQSNLNIDKLTLKGLMMPGITEVRVVPSYFGIGSVGVIIFGNGRESSAELEEFFQRRLYEFITPGQDVRVASGIKVYLDFDIRVYIEKNIPILEQEKIKSDIRDEIFTLIKVKENSRFISFSEISNILKRNIFDSRILGYGTGETNNVFEKVYLRKSDRYNVFPETKEELIGAELNLEEDERLGFGIINLILEERI